MPAKLIGWKKAQIAFKKVVGVATDDKRTVVTALMQGGFVLERGMKKRIRDEGLIDTSNMINGTTADPDPGRLPDVTVGPKTAFYAQFHEFGTIFMPARPFVRPAFDEDQAATIRAVSRYWGRVIETEARTNL